VVYLLFSSHILLSIEVGCFKLKTANFIVLHNNAYYTGFIYLFAKVLVSMSTVTPVFLCCVNCFAVNYRNAHWEHTRMSLGLLSLYAFDALLKNYLTVLYTLVSGVIFFSVYIFVVIIVKMQPNNFEVL
jgi:hypothetical protein